MQRSKWLAGALAVVALGGAVSLGRRALRAPSPLVSAPTRDAAGEPRSAPTTPLPLAPTVLHVPRATGPITIDGEVEEPGWTVGVARTGAFVAQDGQPSTPYSEARLAWGGETLYVMLYAADLDIREADAGAGGPLWLGDSFRLEFSNAGSERVLEVSPGGKLTESRRDGASRGPFDYQWRSGARIATEVEGKINDAVTEDEEWVVELAIPLASIGVEAVPGTTIDVALRRCDVGASGLRRCGSWGEKPPRRRLVLD